MGADSPVVRSLGGQYVTCMLAAEEYGIPVESVQEIIGFRELTRIPRTAPFIKGILNLRGTVVPVVDLRIKFGIASRPYDKHTVIIVVEVLGRIMGIVVDAVRDVVVLADTQIRPAPSLSAAIRADFILGVGAREDGFIILLHLDRVLSPDELEVVDDIV